LNKPNFKNTATFSVVERAGNCGCFEHAAGSVKEIRRNDYKMHCV